MNVTTDKAQLEEALRVNEYGVEQMDITQYLVYMAKLNCNYKLIMASIERCCKDVYVEFYPVYIFIYIGFWQYFASIGSFFHSNLTMNHSKMTIVPFQGTEDFLEGVQIPLHDIFSRISLNPNLKSILSIKNKRFHQMNVFGAYNKQSKEQLSFY